MKILKAPLKAIYYFILGPLYRRVKAEAAEETHAAIQQRIDHFIKEVERVKKLNLDQQSRISQQVADEFVKMYKLIDDIKCDRTDMKLNVTLVNELVKIHQSLEALKNGHNGRE
jgi:hypothetical protein